MAERPEAARVAEVAGEPLTHSEYVTALAHLYRGELYRATNWRLRLDRTSDWAVLTTAGVLTFSFQTDEGLHTHWILLIGIALVTVFLFLEARRYRYEDVWRTRVRLLEEGFYQPILRGEPVSTRSVWAARLADNLARPHFRISFLMAVRTRLKRNYWPVYSLLLFAWCLKTVIHPSPSATTWAQVRGHLELGMLPWWAPLAFIGAHVLALVFLLVTTSGSESSADDRWKT